MCRCCWAPATERRYDAKSLSVLARGMVGAAPTRGNIAVPEYCRGLRSGKWQIPVELRVRSESRSGKGGPIQGPAPKTAGSEAGCRRRAEDIPWQGCLACLSAAARVVW